MTNRMHGLRELVLLMGIFFGSVFGFFVGEEQGRNEVRAGIPKPVPISVTEMENKCVAWFFNADLKAAKKHMCGGK